MVGTYDPLSLVTSGYHAITTNVGTVNGYGAPTCSCATMIQSGRRLLLLSPDVSKSETRILQQVYSHTWSCTYKAIYFSGNQRFTLPLPDIHTYIRRNYVLLKLVSYSRNRRKPRP